jgi:hypothetical protein
MGGESDAQRTARRSTAGPAPTLNQASRGTEMEAPLAHPGNKLAISLMAMIATLALFAAVSALA